MFSPFFALAMRSPGRQQTFRILVVAHLAVLGGAAWCASNTAAGAPVLGHVLLTAGIVEGAMLIGWRLAQVPRSQSLEFLLVSPLRPFWLFTAEALVGLARLALVTLAGLPVLVLLVVAGLVDPLALPLLLVMPWTWGALTGLALTVWAYEPRRLRRWGERAVLVLIVLYLLVGVLAGEHLRDWLRWLPEDARGWVLGCFWGFHTNNPFALLAAWLRRDPWLDWEWTVCLEAGAVVVAGLLLLRGACRLKGHFDERHYLPAVDRSGKRRPAVGNRPLSWWAVKRVTEYAGRVNVWLAGGFGLLYAAYTLAGPLWPGWLGRQVFHLFDEAGGIAALATGLVVLAAVPAAFQYGLWDASEQDRCRRLELLLLTRLDGRDYWEAAAAAAWRRGRGYFAVAVLLWLAAAGSGQATWLQAVAALAAGVLLWGLYFALGFRAFAHGRQANGLGSLLTLGLPLLVCGCVRGGWPAVAALLPPGSVHAALGSTGAGPWLAGLLLSAAVTLGVARLARTRCDAHLRRWYDQHHGRKLMT
jgi:hypothetical protein